MGMLDKGRWKRGCQQTFFSLCSCDEPTTSSSMDLTSDTTELSVPIRKNLIWCTAWFHWHHRSVKEEIMLYWNSSNWFGWRCRVYAHAKAATCAKKKSVCFKEGKMYFWFFYIYTYGIYWSYIYIRSPMQSGQDGGCMTAVSSLGKGLRSTLINLSTFNV